MNKESSIAVLVMTYNEEENLPFLLENVKDWTDEIIILDSFSNDKTIEIAKKYNCKIFYRKFDDFSKQRKFLLNNIPIESSWLIVLDADEYLTEELKVEIKILLESDIQKKDAYFIKRRFYWWGKWIKRGYYPTLLLRFGKKGLIDCDDRPINEHLICKTNNVGYLQHDFVDHNRKNLSAWLNKHNLYSTKEAEALLLPDNNKYNLFASQYERKRWIRNNIWNYLPSVFRPFLYFLYRYIFRGGFLDGREAFVYHFLHAFIYRVLIDFKYLEKKWKKDKK